MFLKAKLLFCTLIVYLFAILERHCKKNNRLVILFLGEFRKIPLSCSNFICLLLIDSQVFKFFREIIIILILTIFIVIISYKLLWIIETNVSINRLKYFLIQKTFIK